MVVRARAVPCRAVAHVAGTAVAQDVRQAAAAPMASPALSVSERPASAKAGRLHIRQLRTEAERLGVIRRSADIVGMADGVEDRTSLVAGECSIHIGADALLVHYHDVVAAARPLRSHAGELLAVY